MSGLDRACRDGGWPALGKYFLWISSQGSLLQHPSTSRAAYRVPLQVSERCFYGSSLCMHVVTLLW